MTTLPGYLRGMDPDGVLAVGTRGLNRPDNLSSYLWENGQVQWNTNFNGSDYESAGAYKAVTRSGIVVGDVPDTDMRLPYVPGGDFAPGRTVAQREEGLGEPVTSAAVWRDGKKYVLGCGAHTIDEFSDASDGSQAVAISPDGSKVYGNIVIAWMPMYGCIWTYDAQTDTYEYEELTRGPQDERAVITAVGSDGTIAGFVSRRSADGQSVNYPAVWNADHDCTIIPMPGLDEENYYWQTGTDAISRDGSKALVHGAGAHRYAGVYDLKTGSMAEIPLPEGTYEALGYAVADNGDAFLAISDYNDYQPRLHYWAAGTGQPVLFSHYLAEAAPEYASRIADLNSRIVGVSEDGTKLAGITGNAWSFSSWILTVDSPEIVNVALPAGVAIASTSPSTVTVTWTGNEGLADGQSLVGYDVYFDGELKERVADKDASGLYNISFEAAPGVLHTAWVRTVAELDGGKTACSMNSAAVSEYVSEDTEIFAFQSFDNPLFDPNDNMLPSDDWWRSVLGYGNEASIINWHLALNDYINRSPYYATYSISTEPWSSQLAGRWYDATGKGAFYLDFMAKVKLLNTPDQDLTTDYLDIEATSDGISWHPVCSLRASDLMIGAWRNFHVDMGEEWGGKMFRLRVNAHGEGRGQLLWQIDNITTSDTYSEEAPTGLCALPASEDIVKLAWHNTLGTYEASYIYNTTVHYDANVGNEGRPMISAVKLTPELLAPFTGKYISGVSSFVFDDPNLGTQSSSVEAMIWDDGALLARGEELSDFEEVRNRTSWLDSPVKIEAGQTYLAGMRLFDYDAKQAPLYYQRHVSAIKGVTDLYSEDEGATWLPIGDALTDSEGNPEQCIWPIRVLITDQPSCRQGEDHNEDLTHYAVVRNGEVISAENVYHSTPVFTDHSPLAEAAYQVRAYYKDGTITQCSAPIEVKAGSGIAEQELATPLAIRRCGHTVEVSGDFDTLRLIDMGGRAIVLSSPCIDTRLLLPGLYLLEASRATSRSIVKIIL